MKAGFTPYATPDLARPEILDGIGFNPRGEETQVYSLANADLCLVGTAEITLGGYYADTIFEEEQLPIRMAGISHCFRTEAGSHGRESRGLYRVHQFSKVEMFAFTRPEDSEAMHEELVGLEEQIFQALEAPVPSHRSSFWRSWGLLPIASSIWRLGCPDAERVATLAK